MKCLTAVLICICIVFNNAEARILNVPEEYQTIQRGIDSSRDGDTVLVAPGRYVENLIVRQARITLGSMILMTEDTSYISSTVIDGDSQGCVITVALPSAEDSLTIRGFTIQHGWGHGGGIQFLCGFVYCSDLTVTHNAGGGIRAGQAAQGPVMRRVRITGNDGGGLMFNSRDLLMEDCEISGNFTDGSLPSGIGSWDAGGQPLGTFRRVVIRDNTGGCVISPYSATINMESCTIADNRGPENSNCDVFRTFDCYFSLNIRNCIVSGFTGHSIVLETTWACGLCEVFHTDIEGGLESIRVGQWDSLSWLEGNLNADPLFLDPDNGDYHLAANSPCIDAGDPNAPFDPDGTRADIGALYFHQRDIEVDTRELHFPAIAWGEVDSLLVTIKNTGGTNLTVSRVESQGDNSCIWVHDLEDRDTLAILAQDSTFAFWVFYQPDEGNIRQTVFRVYSDDPDEELIPIFAFGDVLSAPSDNSKFPRLNLHSAYPNPFNGLMTIRFSVGQVSKPVKLGVYGLDGRLVQELWTGRNARPSQSYSVTWNADSLPGGIYLIRLESGSDVQTVKAVLRK